MEYLKKFFNRTGWMSILESIIFLILGIVLMWKPQETVSVSTYLLGIVFIVVGVYKIINYFLKDGKYEIYNYDMAYGLIAIIIGMCTIIFSGTISSIFRIVIGLWIIYTAIIRMNLSLKLKSVDTNAWLYSLILALIMFICGLYVTLNSGTIVVTVGVFMVVYSVIELIESVIFMRNIKDLF